MATQPKTNVSTASKIAMGCGLAGFVVRARIGTASAPPEAPLPPVAEHP